MWSRLEGFDPDALGRLLLDRKVVRIVVMRATIHLVTADDALGLRPLVQPVLDAELARHREYGPPLRGVDLEPVLAFAREVLAERPLSGTRLRAALHDRFPDHDAAALAYACRNYLALVQVPPRGLWRRSGQVTSTTAESWLGRPLEPKPSIDDAVLRYFGAFGPATVADVTTWSRLTGMREVVERLRRPARPGSSPITTPCSFRTRTAPGSSPTRTGSGSRARSGRRTVRSSTTGSGSGPGASTARRLWSTR
jgi:hypothetical protein